MAQSPLAPGISTYLEALVPPRPPELLAMEAEAARTDFPIIGPAAGHFCYLMTRLIGARAVFELGSGFGYSTAWFARGVQENGGGIVHHVVWDADLSARARKHLVALRLDHLVEFHVGEAVAELHAAAGPFDLIFNDIDKQGYPGSLPVIAQKLRRGGLLLVDNLLWQGQVLDKSDQTADTVGVRELTRLVTVDPAWIASIVPIRDGILVAQRA
ncbi:MAG: O-methyltransferase [Gemmatimonadetes bacterium]|nr:O-methyltransferase [Gemmatimonadota bacterium]